VGSDRGVDWVSCLWEAQGDLGATLTRLGYPLGAATAGAVAAVTALLAVAVPAESSRRSSAASSPDWAYAVAIQRDGRVVAAGTSGITAASFSTPGSFAVARYTSKGKLDASFGRGGRVRTEFGHGYATVVESDGKIIVAGTSYRHGTACGRRNGYCVNFALARYTARGRLDTGFGKGGKVLTSLGSSRSARASAVAIQTNGKLVVAGESDNARGDSDFALARYTVRGRLDPSFGRGGKVVTNVEGRADAIAIQADGKIVVAGAGCLFSSHSLCFALARFTAGGSLDQSFGRGGAVRTSLGEAHAVAIQADGKIVAVGQAGGTPDFALARYTANGRLDASFGEGGKLLTDFTLDPSCSSECEKSNDVAYAAAIQADGKIVAVGWSDAEQRCDGHSCGEFALARYSADGNLDPSFGSGGKVLTHFDALRTLRASSSKAQAVGIQADGKLVVAGLGAGYDFALARYTTRGQLDASFGSSGQVLTDFGSS
jgi:uncharacterized delta-60 repeat protein